MPKKVHDLAKKLEGKKGVDNPFALAAYLVKKQAAKRKRKGRKSGHKKRS